eukprot:g14404.t1
MRRLWWLVLQVYSAEDVACRGTAAVGSRRRHRRREPNSDPAASEKELAEAENALSAELAAVDRNAAAARGLAFEAEQLQQTSLIAYYQSSLQGQGTLLKSLRASAEAKAKTAAQVVAGLKKSLEKLKKQGAKLVNEAREKANDVAKRKTEQHAEHVNTLYTAALNAEREAAGEQAQAEELQLTFASLSDAADEQELAGDYLAAQLTRSEAAQVKLQASRRAGYADSLLADAKAWRGKQKKMEPGTDDDVDALPTKPDAGVTTAAEFLARR